MSLKATPEGSTLGDWQVVPSALLGTGFEQLGDVHANGVVHVVLGFRGGLACRDAAWQVGREEAVIAVSFLDAYEEPVH